MDVERTKPVFLAGWAANEAGGAEAAIAEPFGDLNAQPAGVVPAVPFIERAGSCDNRRM